MTKEEATKKLQEVQAIIDAYKAAQEKIKAKLAEIGIK